MIELNIDEIIIALEHCDGGCCGDCPYLLADCKKELPKKALALINSKKQRIGELEVENKRLRAELAERPPKLVITKKINKGTKYKGE